MQVVTRGSDGEPLESSFRNRSSETYLRSLGNSLVNYFRVIPAGVLVFFPSYTAMDIAVGFWREEGNIWRSMKQVSLAISFPRLAPKVLWRCCVINGKILFHIIDQRAA